MLLVIDGLTTEMTSEDDSDVSGDEDDSAMSDGGQASASEEDTDMGGDDET